MREAWETLCSCGVPAGSIRRPPSGALPAAEVAQAVQQLASANFSDLNATERECLLAWLRAFRHHWPQRFEAILGATGRAALSALEAAGADPDRYLKLRRIAIENLAASL